MLDGAKSIAIEVGLFESREEVVGVPFGAQKLFFELFGFIVDVSGLAELFRVTETAKRSSR